MAKDAAIRMRLSLLEAEAAQRPGRHALRLWVLAGLGYAYPVAVGMVPLAVVVLWVAVSGVGTLSELMLVCAAVAAGGVAVSLWMFASASVRKMEDAVGMRISRAEAPALWAMVDEVCREVGVREVNRLALSEELNAAATQRRRWRVLGRWESTVILGVPLMMALGEADLRVVVAHEVAHLRGQHVSLALRFYRVHLAWEQLAAVMKGVGKTRRVIFGWFVAWYWQRVAVTTLAIRRRYEFEADAAGAKVGGERGGAALARLSWVSYLWERRFVPELWTAAGEVSLPPGDVILRFRRFLDEGGVEDVGERELMVRRWREREQLTHTPVTSAHPCLRDRLEAIGAGLMLEDRAGVTVAAAGSEHLLGESHRRVLDVMNARIKSLMMPGWRERYELARRVRSNREPVRMDVEIGRCAEEVEWDTKQTELEAMERREAIMALQAMVEKNPGHGRAMFMLGKMLLREDDQEGVEVMERAIRVDSECIWPGLASLLDHYREMGRDDEADKVRERMAAFEKDAASSRKERVKVGSADEFEPHGLSAADLVKLRGVLHRYSGVRAAFLVRKKLRLFADKPSYVVIVVPRRGRSWVTQDWRSEEKRLRTALQGGIPLSCAVTMWGTLRGKARKQVVAMCAEPIFDMDRDGAGK